MDLGFWKGKKVLVTGGAGFLGSTLSSFCVIFGSIRQYPDTSFAGT
jgi:FlaA1/EpsC-like NDP-sugar epimerase